ncbi:putative MATE family efflux protein [Enterococcus sp. PF1-24]|uniref:MATE family efflux transporter n=1 Tax=unclassified Enterococcus TaxID=2608891 RepID=UPI0024744066|nr:MULTISPECIES: MATE family efflux transporter [unclassified Enterococcus]MDH6364990.1 putative MATE family efflux protein [Enterococcus sp. PFB1-1]MDH6402091.1 putative MATE family efflux protein [Enterococcus sp. PF1-24]
MEVKKNKMATGKLLPLIISMSLPPIFSMLIQSLYNIVDSMFVAKISNEALTAVSLAFPIQNLILALSVGFGAGLNAFIARKMGNKEQAAADQAATIGVILSVVHYLVVVVLGLLFGQAFLGIFSNNQEILDLSNQYVVIIIIFALGQSVQITIEKIFQACGHMIEPMFFQLIGAIVNVILDPIFIFGWLGLPAMGVRGAAIATVIGQSCAMLAALIALKTRKLPVTFDFKNIKWDWQMIREIYIISLPSFLLTSISSVMVSSINIILNGFSDLSVAVFGIYYKLQSFVYMPISGLVQGTLPIMSFNYGGKNKTRLLATLKITLIIASTFSVIGMLLFWLLPNQIIGMFSSDPEILTLGKEVIQIISLSFFFGGLCFVFSSYFQATASPVFSLILTLLRQLFFVTSFAYLLSRIFGLTGVWWAFVLAESITALIALVMFKYDYGRKRIYHNKN